MAVKEAEEDDIMDDNDVEDDASVLSKKLKQTTVDSNKAQHKFSKKLNVSKCLLSICVSFLLVCLACDAVL